MKNKQSFIIVYYNFETINLQQFYIKYYIILYIMDDSSGDDDFPIVTINSTETIDALFENNPLTSNPIDTSIYIPGFNVVGEYLYIKKLPSGRLLLKALISQILPAQQVLWTNVTTSNSTITSDRIYRTDNDDEMKNILYRFVEAGGNIPPIIGGVKRRRNRRSRKSKSRRLRKSKSRKNKYVYF
jgi:hypothetical protein